MTERDSGSEAGMTIFEEGMTKKIMILLFFAFWDIVFLINLQ